MGGWNIFYALINFSVLAFLLWRFGRKFVVNMLQGQRKDISDALEAAKQAEEEAKHIAATLDKTRDEGLEQCRQIVQLAQEKAQRSLEQSTERARSREESYREQTRKEMEYIYRRAIDMAKDESLDALIAMSAELLEGPGYEECRARMPERFVMQLEEKLRLSGSDKAKLRWGDSLEAELSYAQKPEDKVLERVEALLKKLCGEAFSLSMREDPQLIGGMRLRLEDSVYDGSLAYMLEDEHRRLSETQCSSEDLPGFFRDSFSTAGTDMGTFQTGVVEKLADGICTIHGLSDVMAGEMLEFEGGLRGMVMDIEQNSVSAVLLGEFGCLHEGGQVRRTGKVMEVPVGEQLIGRVVDALGRPIDGQGPVDCGKTRPVESPAPGIIDRKPVTVPLQTGIKAIDALVPIGRGQRELIIGDRKTGKTSIAIDTIINQKGKDVICIYVAIGQKESTVAGIVDKLFEHGAMEHSIVVSAKASDPAPMLYIAPYTGAAMGEELMAQGKHVLIVYDDLSRHAVAYRELSLLLHRPPGREAYPGDVFYLHSRLLERAASLSDEKGGGSMTALPIVETQAGDISAYIPTNVISITDGQIFLEESLFNSGVRPAINAGLSVSRVGGAAQPKAMKQFASRLRMDLAQHRELESFAQFGSDLDKATRQALERGRKVTELLKQRRFDPKTVSQQVVAIFAANEGFMDDLDIKLVSDFEERLTAYAADHGPELCAAIDGGDKLDKDQIQALRELISQFKKDYLS